MASAEVVAVFVETNLGTHIAMAVPLDITAGDFKRQLEKTHASCSPSLGDIQVYGLMVKRKSYFYYLPEPMPIKHIFQDLQKAWFISAEARFVSCTSEPCVSNSTREAEVVDCSGSGKPIEGIISLSNGIDGKPKKSVIKHVSGEDISTSENKKTYKECVSCLTSERLESEPVCLDKGGTRGSQTPDHETIPPLSKAEAPNVRDGGTTLSCSHRSGLKNFKAVTAAKQRRDYANSQAESDHVRKKLLAAANNIRTRGQIQISSTLSSIHKSETARRRLPDRKIVASLAKFLVFQIPETESED